MAAIKTSTARLSALEAVNAGLVYQVFTRKGNIFRVPKSISSVTVRQLEHDKLIEPMREQKPSHIGQASYVHVLTPAGVKALARNREIVNARKK